MARNSLGTTAVEVWAMGKLSWNGPTSQHSEKLERWWSTRMWIAMQKPYSSGKHAEKRKKQQPTENQKNTKTKLQAKWGTSLYI